MTNEKFRADLESRCRRIRARLWRGLEPGERALRLVLAHARSERPDETALGDVEKPVEVIEGEPWGTESLVRLAGTSDGLLASSASGVPVLEVRDVYDVIIRRGIDLVEAQCWLKGRIEAAREVLRLMDEYPSRPDAA